MWEMARIYELWEGLGWQLHCIAREMGVGGALCLAFACCHCDGALWRPSSTIVGPDLLFPPLCSGHTVPAWPLTTSVPLRTPASLTPASLPPHRLLGRMPKRSQRAETKHRHRSGFCHLLLGLGGGGRGGVGGSGGQVR